LLWWIRDSRLPPLVTVGPPGSTAALGPTTTQVIVGGNDLDHESFSGGRFRAGMWLNECQTIGIEGDYFFLGSRSNNISVSGTGAPGTLTVARPFFNVLTGAQDTELVAASGLLSGTINISATSRLEGGELNGIVNLCCSCCDCACCDTGYRVDLLAGFRYLELDEGLTIGENLTILPGAPANAGTRFALADEFGARNHFYGGQIGARSEYRRGKWFADAWGEIALGDNHETATINGVTVITLPGAAPVARVGGLLALPTNIGHFSRDEFSVVPEIGINVGYQVSQHLRAFVGYTFLYWSDVQRPADLIDVGINGTQVPSNLGSGTLVGPARPTVILHSTDFWAQGISFGVEVRF
jgi:hypothetical protein